MLLAICELRYRYPGGVTALAGVDLDLAAGELCALVGANGSGKSTCLSLAALMLKPEAGRVELFGRVRAGPRQIASRVAWIGQELGLDPTMSGAEHLDLQAALMGLSRRASVAKIAALVDGLRLKEALFRRVSAYSGGMRRRLHIALGLVHHPELLLLDEPTAGLDPEGRDVVWRFLASRAAAGEGLLIVTHDLAEVLKHATKLVFLDEGLVVGVGAPADIANCHQGDLQAAYGKLTGREGRSLFGNGISENFGESGSRGPGGRRGRGQRDGRNHRAKHG